MEIKGKVHCFFEQSGTFKNEFIKLNIPAEDYDIQNNFGETDHVTDLFKEIENAYDGKSSIFDTITKDDLIVAFFPCIYFCAMSQMAFYPTYVNYRCKTTKETYDLILKRNEDRAYFYSLLMKLFCVVRMKGLRMIVENPWSEQTYLKANFEKPQLVDMNRMLRGDYYKKPTAYWFVNCEPTDGFTHQEDKEKKTILNSKGSGQAGICSEDRSLISHDYARNWICDFVLGITQERFRHQEELSLF